MPQLLRLAIAVGLPLSGAATIVATYFNKEILLCAGWFAVCIATFLLAAPVIGISLMTGAFLMAAYPSALQALGALTVNNLLGVLLLVLMGLRIVATRDFSVLRTPQIRLLALIGVFFILGTFHSYNLFPTLQATVGKTKVLDKSTSMGHDFTARLIYLMFFVFFVRDRRDIRILFVTVMLGLFVAVPSSLYNMATGQLNRGFRLQASVTSGANPNRLAMICLLEVAMWWFWARSRPGIIRNFIALGAMGGSVMVVFGTGSRSGLLGVGLLGFLLQTSPRKFRVPYAQLGLLVVAAVFAIVVVVPPEAWQRMITFNPQQGEIAATSNRMREETIWRAIQVAQDYPALGVGIGNFREVTRQVYADLYYRPPHNSFLWAAAEGGAFVLLTYLLLFWITFKDLRVVRRLAYRDPELDSEAAGVYVAAWIYAFFCIFADLWLNPITYAMMGLIIVMRRYVESLPEPAAVTVLPRAPARRAVAA